MDNPPPSPSVSSRTDFIKGGIILPLPFVKGGGEGLGEKIYATVETI
jgi:hypothetical protein